MGRDKNQVIHLFKVRDTLVPYNMTMDTKFVDFFEDWALGNKYALLSDRNIQALKSNIPESILFKSEYTFINGGDTVTQLRGKKTMRSLGYPKPYNSLHDLVHFLLSSYTNINYFSPKNGDPIFAILDQLTGHRHFFIDEWKDTALFLKQLHWDSVNA